MEQLIFFAELPSIDASELEGRIDPELDAAFLSEVERAFAAHWSGPAADSEADAA